MILESPGLVYPTRHSPRFDGGDDYGSVANHASIQDIFSGGGTVGGYFIPRGLGDANPAILAKTDGSAGWYIQAFPQSGTSFLFVLFSYFSDGGAVWAVVNPFDYNIPNICRFWVAYDSSSPGNDPTIFINGTKNTIGNGGLVETVTKSGTSTSDAAFSLGVGSVVPGSGAQSFKGLVWDVCFKSSVISDGDVASDYRFNDLPDSDFVARYKMDEDDFPTDTGANSGTGGAGAMTVSGAVSENHVSRFQA